MAVTEPTENFRPGTTAAPHHQLALALVLGLSIMEPLASLAAQPADRPTLHTNEAYVEETQRPSALAIADPMAVFAYVLGSLPDRVKVYPTENYYYFRFIHAGTPYAGAIRLDPRGRDDGKLEFGYYPDLVAWNDRLEAKRDVFLTLDATRGVKVERVDRLVYRITYGAKSVVFALNDLSKVRPPGGTLGPGEKFIGPIFDESAVRFFLVFNTSLKIFHYVLDETVPVTDELVAAAETDRILIGRRTGFAFYRDHRLARKILIGVFDSNSQLNTYFDGPFDQLPENFIEGETLREAIHAADPSTRGRIDRLGHFADGEDRFAIDPYMLYRTEAELLVIDKCAGEKREAPDYYRCFVAPEAR